jgi:hypothetical protein
MSEQQEKKRFSLDEVLNEVTGKTYREVEVYGGIVTVGSLSSADMLEFLMSNDDADAAKATERRRTSGPRLIAQSVVDPVTKRHLTADEQKLAVEKFRQKDAKQNGILVNAILDLNGLNKPAVEIKNA